MLSLRQQILIHRIIGRKHPYKEERQLTEVLSANPDLLNTLLSDLDFPPKAYRYFKYLKLSTLSDLVNKSESDFLSLRNCGAETVFQIKLELRKFGLHLK